MTQSQSVLRCGCDGGCDDDGDCDSSMHASFKARGSPLFKGFITGYLLCFDAVLSHFRRDSRERKIRRVCAASLLHCCDVPSDAAAAASRRRRMWL